MDRLRLESLLWGKSSSIRRWLRAGRGRLADFKHLLRTTAGRRPSSRIRTVAAAIESSAFSRRRHRWIVDDPTGAEIGIPIEIKESLRLVAAAEDLEVVVLSKPRDSSSADASEHGIRFKWLSMPTTPVDHHASAVPIRTASRLTAKTLRTPGRQPAPPAVEHPFDSVDGYWLPHGRGHGQRMKHRVYDAFHVLQDLPELEGPPTLLFLLPFLAVGGAERLLFDLLADLKARFRCLVVTLEPHRPQLGITLGRCTELTPYVFTLGDWLPREAHFGALSHLIRRFAVESLISWNGTVFFFDRVAELRSRFPDLRISSQLYHFEGGWTARTSPEVIRAVDLHIAVNGPIRESLVKRLRISPDRVELIHHGVSIPEQTKEPAQKGSELRQKLGIPENAVVIGSFIRLHPQKRPLDILRLAERFNGEATEPELPWFLLMGGGPMDDEIDRRLADRPIPRLTRLPMQTDPLPYYDALDLCLMTSDYEGLPVFLLDGMARGLPAVAPAVGDIPFLLNEGGGLTSGAPGDLDALEQAIRRLLEPQTRAEAARIARKTIEDRFDLKTYCAAYEQAFLGRHERESAGA